MRLVNESSMLKMVYEKFEIEAAVKEEKIILL